MTISNKIYKISKTRNKLKLQNGCNNNLVESLNLRFVDFKEICNILFKFRESQHKIIRK